MFGTSHVLAMGVQGWPRIEAWPGNLPPITLLSVLIPMVVIFLKVIEMIFTRFADCLFANPEYYNQFEQSWDHPSSKMATLKTSEGEGSYTHQASLTSSRSSIDQTEGSVALVSRKKSATQKKTRKAHKSKKHRDISLSAQSLIPLTKNSIPHYDQLEGSYKMSLADDDVLV